MAEGITGIVERINQLGARHVETSGRAFLHGMRRAADAAGSEEAADVADAIELSLVMEGADGLLDLALCGPALTGLGDNDIARLLAVIDERAAEAASTSQG